MEWFKLDLIAIITITGIAQGIFLLSALLTTEKGEHLVNRMFACLISVFSLDILFSIIFASRQFYPATSFLRIDQCIQFLYGPLFLFYTKLLCSHSLSFEKKEIPHFFPFLLSFFIILPFSLFTPGVALENLAQFMRINLYGLIDMLKVLSSLAVFIHMTSYLLFCYRKILKYKTKMIIHNKNEYLIHKMLTITCFIYNGLCMISSFTHIFIQDFSILAYIPPICITLVIYLFGYTSILKPELLFISWEKGNNPSVYKKINLSEEQSKEYLKRLFAVMEKEKLYKDQDLTLSLLAEQVHLSRNLLSYLLNNVIGTNFYDFINGFRVEAVKDLLANDTSENENILNIAFYAGFNSKSAFNKIFKKFTHMSPSEYRKDSMKVSKDKKIFSRMMKLNLIEDLENRYDMKSIARTS
ncbi:MAG: AraC family transcriptional regulator [Spirochaetales bacterium]|nr:AraC family transcriptional regulator [Spirochaetales bacterium]